VVRLEDLVGVVASLDCQELTHLRIAALDLIATRPAVIRQIVAAVVRNAEVDELPERLRGRLEQAGARITTPA